MFITPARRRARLSMLPSSRASRRAIALVAAAVSLLLTITVIPTGAAIAAEDSPAQISIQKTIAAPVPNPFKPTDTVNYEVQMQCSNVNGFGCDDAVFTDPIPAPLVLQASTVSVSGLPTTQYAVTTANNTVSITFAQPTGSGTFGLIDGQTYNVRFSAVLPATVSGDANGVPIPNTASLAASNAVNSPVTDTVSITPVVPLTLTAGVTKSFSPTAIAAVPGTPVAITLGASNTSNRSIDELTLQDPADNTSGSTFDYLDVTGISSLTMPTGADRVRLEWLSTTSNTWISTGPAAVPNTATLLPSPIPADFGGVRLFFSKAGGTLPTTATTGAAKVVFSTTLNAAVAPTIVGTVPVANTASSTTRISTELSPVATQAAELRITKADLGPTVTKQFAASTLVPGESTRATVSSLNGDFPIVSMVIDEPLPGTATLADQGLDFAGFAAADIEWPMGATSASVRYLYGDTLGTPGAIPTTTRDTIAPPESGRTVIGFTVTFTGTMAAHEYAALPFTVTALPVVGTADSVATNIAQSTVTTADGQTNSNNASDDLTRTPARVFTTTSKTVLPAEAFAVQGASSLVQLGSTVKAIGGADGSTVGAEYLSITDPAVPSAAIDPYWDRFDIAKIARTAVPASSALSVSYWDGSVWTPLPDASNVAGPTVWSYTVPAELRDLIRGVRFTFTPTGSAALLPPGFSVTPNVQFALRPSLRSDASQPTVDPDATEPLVVTNTVRSEVGNVNADPAVATADADDSIALKPTSGAGIDLVDKFWLDDPTLVTARSGDTATARLSWSTHGIAFDRLRLADPATSTTGALPPVEQTSFEAFNLVSVEPITAASDPLIVFDRVAQVELYSALLGWVDVTGQACASAAACDGEFAGFTLTDQQQQTTLGVRLSFEESPTRASRSTSVFDPAEGSGVAASDAGRAVDLVFQLRDTRRSDGQPALGSDHTTAIYNVAGSPGVVSNDVRADGFINADIAFTDTASDTAIIIDSPLNVLATKTWKYDPLGLPPIGAGVLNTDPLDFPIAEATLTASNTTAARVDSLELADPDVTIGAAQKSPYDVLNLQKIESITVPAGATATAIYLSYDTDPSTESSAFSITEARALTEAELAHVVAIRIVHTGRIESAAAGTVSTTAVLLYRLRAEDRSTHLPVKLADTSINTVSAIVRDAGGIVATDVNTAHATDTLEVVKPGYGVTSTKTILPATSFEDDANRTHVVTLAATPNGTVRTRTISYTDVTPTFWNAYAFGALRPITTVTPVTAVRVDALVGVTYALEGTELVARCATSLVLDDCWVNGVRKDLATGSTSITPTLPSAVSAADVRGLRFTFSRADGKAWERPFNPTQPASFSVSRRVDLLTGGPVPSTLSTLDIAPGETLRGTATNTLEVLATGAWGDPDAPGGPAIWTATSSSTATIILQHRSNGIQIVKGPFGPVGPGQEIPFTIAVKNTGAWAMTGLAITDTIESDAIANSTERRPRLVAPELDVDDPGIYSYSLVNSAGVALTAPVVTPVQNADKTQTAFGLPAGFVLAPGNTLTIGIRLVTRADIPAGETVENAAVATSDRVFDTCSFATNTVLEEKLTVPTPECSTVTTVSTMPSAPLRVVKGVKGTGAGVLGADPSDDNYDDLGVLAYPGAPSTDYCSIPRADAASAALAGYYRTPCIPITRPGATETWKTVYTNTGNIPARTVSAIDVLPAAGDRGVIINQLRSSRWTPTFVGGIDLTYGTYSPTTTRLLYSTTVPNTLCNRLDILNSVTPGGVTAADVNPAQNPGETTACLAEINARQWLEYDESMTAPAKAAIKAFKIVLTYQPGQGLLPGEVFGMTWNSTTAAFPVRAESQDRDSVAWNSVAASSSGYDSNDNLRITLVTEARKVGVAMATGKLDLSKTIVTPAGFPATPAGYRFTVECTSLGQNVPLVGVPVGSGAAPDASVVTLQSDGTVLHYNDGASPATSDWSNVNLPLYADCGITERPAAVGEPDINQGSVVTVGPRVTALRDYTTRTDIADAAFAEAVDPEDIAISAVNDYEFADFTVSKIVSQGSAVDAAGTAITRSGPYTFQSVCTFLAVPTTTTFTLVDGASHRVSNVPAGSTCVLTETTANGAANATTTMGVNGAAATTGKSVSFVAARNTGDDSEIAGTAVAVSNAYGTGAVRLTKAFAGAGAAAWGDLEYTARLVCTLVGATPATVYDNTFTLSKTAPTSTITNLANGASCTVTEPGRGGANSAAIAPATLTVGTNPATPTVVTITNTFTVGTLRVTKALAGAPAASLAGATGFAYEVSVQCTRPVDGVATAIAVPGGATRTITGAGFVDYTGLPTGATCVVSETNQGLAQSSALTPVGGSVVIGNATTVGVTVTNTFANGSVPVHKEVTGPASANAPASFSATVACDWHGSSVPLTNGGVITITDGNTTTLAGVPIGSVCTVSEADAGQVTPVISTPTQVTVGATTTLALNLVNDYEFASLRVTKTVTSPAANVPGNFGFGVQCTFLGATVLDETFTLNDGGDRVFTELPARSTCVVTETDDMNADGTVSSGFSATGAVVLDQAARTVTISELSPDVVTDTPRNSAGFENLYDASVVTVTKTLHGGGAAQFGQQKQFTAHVTCTFAAQTLRDEDVQLSESNGFTASFGDLVAGSSCSITETDLEGADAVVITPNDGADEATGLVTVPASGVVNADIANWYLTGSMLVTKTFAGAAATRFGTRDYSIELSCSRDGETIAIVGGGQRTVSATSPTALFTALPSGAGCSLVELDAGGATSTRIVDGNGDTLVDDAADGFGFTVVTSPATLAETDQPQPTLAVENRFDFATASASKSVQSTATDAAGDLVTYGPFEVVLTCELAGEPVTAAETSTRSILDGETVVWTQLPVGALCSIEETDAADAASTAIAVTQADAAAPVVLAAEAVFTPLVGLADGDNAAAISNTFESASVDIVKVVDGTDAARASGSYPVQLTCVLVDASHPAPGLTVRDVTAQIGGSQALTLSERNIPSGSRCTVTETNAGGADRTSVARTGGDVAQGTTLSFTLASAVASATTVTVTNTFSLALASTGFEALWLLWLALGILAAGVALLFSSLRRRPARR